MLHTFFFGGDQVLTADASYVFWKLREIAKSECLKVDEDKFEEPQIKNGLIKRCKTKKCLGVTLKSHENNIDGINNKVTYGEKAITQLNTVL